MSIYYCVKKDKMFTCKPYSSILEIIFKHDEDIWYDAAMIPISWYVPKVFHQKVLENELAKTFIHCRIKDTNEDEKN